MLITRERWTSSLAPFFVVVLLGAGAAAQSLSPIGTFLLPWTDVESANVTITPDGSTIVFVEQKDSDCFTGAISQRISTTHSDGTGYRIVLDSDALPPWPNGFTLIGNMRISGDGQTLWFLRPDQVNRCVGIGPSHDYLVDMLWIIDKDPAAATGVVMA